MPLKIYLTDKDLQTLKFVEQYGSITNNICANIFYNNQIYSKQTANKHLNKLIKYGKLKVYRDTSGNENVYYNTKKLSYHDLLSLDFYSKLIKEGANVFWFRRNFSWLDDKYISDAFCCYSINNKIYFNIIEVTRTHGLDKRKYLELYESKEPQQYCNEIYNQLTNKKINLNVFPKVIVIDNTEHIDNYLFINNNIDVRQLDFKLNKFATIFI